MQLYAARALLRQGWEANVVLRVDERGQISDIDRAAACPEGAEAVSGPLLPGMTNLHSHAFQRAFAGETERRQSSQDDFWAWRRVMYELVARLTPDHSEAITEQLYIEMLKAGYTAVGEFHYVHHGPGGRPYASPSEMSDRVVEAAEAAGIALTLLPVFYSRGGFAAREPDPGQRRFVHDLDGFAALLETLFARHSKRRDFRLGIAPHSLRAVSGEELTGGVAVLGHLDPAAPVHIHVAEQTTEVEDCLRTTGQRPVSWLLDHAEVDGRWCLVHATHTNRVELERIAAQGAVVGLCPTTEANLGDGLFEAQLFLGADGRFGIGSGSNVSVSPVEELRWLEYGQRLLHRRRALLAPVGGSVGRHLYEHAARGGAQALGLGTGTIETGHRADLIVLDPAHPSLNDLDGDAILDAMVFAGNLNPVKDVMVGGRWQVRDGHHEREETALTRFRAAKRELLRNPRD